MTEIYIPQNDYIQHGNYTLNELLQLIEKGVNTMVELPHVAKDQQMKIKYILDMIEE
jgi:hypothetical protein